MVRACSLMRPTVIKLLIESAPQKLPLLMTGSLSKSHENNLLKRLHVNKRLCHSDSESTSACKVCASYQKLIHLYWSERGRITSVHLGFLGGSDRKDSACNVGDLGYIPELGRSCGGGHGNPLQYSCLENLHRNRSLAGYSTWGLKELDMTEWLSTAYGIILLIFISLNIQ